MNLVLGHILSPGIDNKEDEIMLARHSLSLESNVHTHGALYFREIIMTIVRHL